jgi:chaperonin GroEL
MSENKFYLRSNIIDQKETVNEISDTLNDIATCVGKSLGPYGSTTIIQGSIDTETTMSKDGYTILKGIRYYFDIPKMVLYTIKKISKSLVRTVGDGSTSSVIIANELFDNIIELTEKFNIAPKDIILVLNKIADILEKSILKESNKITDDNFDESITKIASISTNNNTEVGKLFCEIFKRIGKYGFINLQKGKNSKDSYEIKKGIEVNFGWINQRMATMNDKVSYEYENPIIFMCNDVIGDEEMEYIAKLMQNYCLQKDTPLILIAKAYSSSFKAFIDSNLQRNKHLPFVAIDFDINSPKGKSLFEDLATVLNCHYYDKFNGMEDINDFKYEDFGKCKLITGDDLRTTFLNGEGYKDYYLDEEKEIINEDNIIVKRIHELEEEYEKINSLEDNDDHEVQLFNIKKRIAVLSGSLATIYVGGNSELEIDSRKYLFEDAVYACKSAIEYGYIAGCNTIVPLIINSEMNDIINQLKEDEELSYLKNSIYYKDSNLNNDFNIDEFYKTILEDIEMSFLYSYSKVLSNANLSNKHINNIVSVLYNDKKIYNLKNRQFESVKETSVINSAQTDIEIIKSSFSIIGLLATSNQTITVNMLTKDKIGG